MKKHFFNAWSRFSSAVPPAERKLQKISSAAAVAFGGIAGIAWAGKATIICIVAGDVASGCTSAVFLLQFAIQAQTILETKTEVTVTQTVSASEVPSNE